MRGGVGGESAGQPSRRHPVIERIMKPIRELQERARFQFTTHEFDGASGNDRLFAHLAYNSKYNQPGVYYQASGSRPAPPPLDVASSLPALARLRVASLLSHEDVLCHNHQEHLGQLTLLGAMGASQKSLTSDLFCSSMFLSNSGHWRQGRGGGGRRWMI